ASENHQPLAALGASRAGAGKRTAVNLGLRLGGCPVVRQELGQLGNRMVGNPGQNVLQPTERIDAVPLAGCHEAPYPFRYNRSRHSTSNVTCPSSSSGILAMPSILCPDRGGCVLGERL